MAAAVLMALMVTPSLVFLVNLPHFGSCQYNDYYGIINKIREGRGFTRNPLRWLGLKSNEHTVTLPAMVYVANIWLTHGDNRGLSVFAIALLFVIFFLLRRILLTSLDLPPPGRWVAGFLLAAAVFSPAPSHSVVMGFSGAIWFLSNALAVAALFLLWRQGGTAPIWPVLLAGGLGALSYSTNLSLWPALAASALVQRRSRRDIGGIVAVGFAVAVFLTMSYQPNPAHPQLDTAHPLTVLIYAAVYIGGFLAGSTAPAVLFGSLGLLCSVALYLVLLRRGPETGRRAAPWLGLQIYAFGNALGTGVGRAGFGIHQALSSRYSSVSALFWVSLGFLLVLVLRGAGREETRPKTPVALSAAVAVIVTMTGASWLRGAPVLEEYLLHARRQPLAAEALRLDVFDLSAIRTLTFIPVTRAEVQSTAAFLRGLDHVPFNRPSESWRNLPKQVRVAQGGPPVVGSLEGTAWIDASVIRVSGWAWNPGDPVAEVLIVDEEERPLARMVTGLPRSVTVSRNTHGSRFSGWAGYLPPGTVPGRLRAVAHLASGRWRFIPGEAVLPPGPEETTSSKSWGRGPERVLEAWAPASRGSGHGATR